MAILTMPVRDIYYRDPLLYKHQATVDRYVDDIAYTCHATRKDIHVVSRFYENPVAMYGLSSNTVNMSDALGSGQIANEVPKTASSKGLFAGLNLNQATLSDADEGFQAVPDFDVNLEQSSLRQIRWILVIEKEARTFPNTF